MSESAGRILFVEDHPDVREALGSLVEDFGYTVIPAESAEEGMEKLLAEPFDLVITDHSLPDKTGTWLLQEAVQRGIIPRDRGMIITALPQVPEGEGFVVLRKPLDIDEFLDEVSKRLGSPPTAAPPTSTTTVLTPLPNVPVELALYVTASSPRSHKALKTLERLLRECDPTTFRLHVCDLSAGFHAEAEEDRVTFTPTLVKRSPGTRSWLVGDFQDVEKVSALLGVWGVAVREG